MAVGDYANTRYSPLDQIKSANASQLKLAWSFNTGIHRGQEAAPVVVRDTMYVVTPYPNVLYAFDLRNNGAGKCPSPNRRRRAWPTTPATTIP